ncbi:MAG: alpha-isopropylmalate synthase regulatory domain-containing protein [Pseudomonadota bacterium]
MADRKKDMFDADIESIILTADSRSGGPWTMSSFAVSSGTGQSSQAEITLIDNDGQERTATAAGNGPIEAAAAALADITGIELVLTQFELKSLSTGEDAQGNVVVTVEHDGEAYRGHGLSTDIVEAGTRAHLEVTNRILRRRAADGTLSRGSTVSGRATV